MAHFENGVVCEAAGIPCPSCQKSDDRPELPPDWPSIASTKPPKEEP
jgi:hypothetical protein